MKIEKAIFACGCFWGVQHQMERAQGVVSSTVGYTGGKEQHPTYQELHVRWFQWGCFMPLMRNHCSSPMMNEIDLFGKEGDWAYDAQKRIIP